ncbi:MAG: hypothetical protein H6716_20470 [Polyangiaceae bacterium]|nr:hypothetical protein [Polyangiaceae bacterium]
MSMYGERRLELERAQRERVRLGHVSKECIALADACDEVIRGVHDVAVQQLAAAELSALVPAIQTARNESSTSPDAALATLVTLATKLHDVLARAEAGAKRWSSDQADAIAQARRARTIAAATAPSSAAADVSRRAVEAAMRGDLAEASRLSAEAVESSTAVASAGLDEAVRREIVGRVIETLKSMGFVVVPPRLEAGVVTLEGRLASGRRARFDVSLDGATKFDLDGYEGRACGDELEKIETTLRDKFGVRMGPPQIVWKNPDRISRGARDLPGGRKKGQ